MQIVERMFFTMKAKKLKSVDLAKKLGISKSVVSSWKSRSTNPPSEYIVPICEFLGVSLHFLLTGEEEQTEEFNSEEIRLIHMFRELHPEIKHYITESVQHSYEEKSGKETSYHLKNNDSGIA